MSISFIDETGKLSQFSKPLVFISKDRAQFSEMDPYGHMNTQFYVYHYLAHRMTCMRTYLNWDLKFLTECPMAFVVKDLNIQFLSSVVGDREFEIQSYISEVKEKTCMVEIMMRDVQSTKLLSTCKMNVACLDKKTGRTIPWPEDIIQQLFVK